VINRGNYRRDVFESVGAAKAFESALEEVCETFRWRIHGYVNQLGYEVSRGSS
jgi:putative transposase